MVRHKIPKPYGNADTTSLYRRFISYKARAKLLNLPFQWGKFSDFLGTISEIGPEDYHPNSYTIKFDPKLNKGYSSESMTFLKVIGKPRGKGNHKLREPNLKWDRDLKYDNMLMSAASIVRFTPYDSLDRLIEEIINLYLEEPDQETDLLTTTGD